MNLSLAVAHDNASTCKIRQQHGHGKGGRLVFSVLDIFAHEHFPDLVFPMDTMQMKISWKRIRMMKGQVKL